MQKRPQRLFIRTMTAEYQVVLAIFVCGKKTSGARAYRPHDFLSLVISNVIIYLRASKMNGEFGVAKFICSMPALFVDAPA